MKVIYVKRTGVRFDVYVYSINLSKRILTVRNYCNYAPSCLVIYRNTFSSRALRMFLECINHNDSSSVHEFFDYEVEHGSKSILKISNNPFFTSDGKPRRCFYDYL